MAGGKVMMRRQADVHDDHVRTVLPVCIQSGFGVPRIRYDLDVRLDIQRSGKAQADHERSFATRTRMCSLLLINRFQGFMTTSSSIRVPEPASLTIWIFEPIACVRSRMSNNPK
jgi:hypothetical protein